MAGKFISNSLWFAITIQKEMIVLIKILKIIIMIEVSPFLSFNGNCESAFNFYKSIFGGAFEFIYRYKDVPSEKKHS